MRLKRLKWIPLYIYYRFGSNEKICGVNLVRCSFVKPKVFVGFTQMTRLVDLSLEVEFRSNFRREANKVQKLKN